MVDDCSNYNLWLTILVVMFQPRKAGMGWNVWQYDEQTEAVSFGVYLF